MIEFKMIDNKEEKVSISSMILRALPQWFGLSNSTNEYIIESSDYPFIVAYKENQAVGFIALKENTQDTVEIYVMGVLELYHRQGIGSGLIDEGITWSVNHGYRLMQVKTLDATHPDVFYAKTRSFYKTMGFISLECIPEIWGDTNPCLIMVKGISNKGDLL